MKISSGRPLVWWTRLVFKHLTIKRRAKVTTTMNSHCVRIMICHYLRSTETSVTSPCHPHFASDNRSMSIAQYSWEGGEGSPGCGIREEGEHRRKVVSIVIPSSGNNKYLQDKRWVGPISLPQAHDSVMRGWGSLFIRFTPIISETLVF